MLAQESRFDFSKMHIKLKNSIFCGIKGFLICNLAALTALQQFIYFKSHKQHTPYNVLFIHTTGKRAAQYAASQNIVPFAEVALVMPIIFIITHCMTQYGLINTPTNPFNMYMICLAICMALMVLICLTLRILKIRKDCCSYLEHPIYRNHTYTASNSSFINFKAASLINLSNNTNDKQVNPTQYGAGYYITNLLFSMLTAPLKLLIAILELTLFCITVLEIPLCLLLDTGIAIYHTVKPTAQKERQYTEIKKTIYHHSKENVEQAFSLLYAGLRDLLVGSSLGLLGFEFIIPVNSSHPRSLISYVDKLFTTQTDTSENIHNIQEKTSSTVSHTTTEHIRPCCQKKCS